MSQGYAVLAVVLILMSWFLARYTAPQPKPAPLVFGLAQVQAAKAWAHAHNHGEAVVKAAVVWTTNVLNYTNTVREETNAEVSAIDGANSERKSGIDQRNDEVAALKTQIAYLEQQIRYASEQRRSLQADAERYGTGA